MNQFDEIELEEVEELLSANETAEALQERFRITDLSSLNWALRKLSALNKSHEEERALAKAENERIQEWFARQDETYQRSTQFFEVLIGEYAKEQRTADPKWKGKSPYGLVSFRKQQPEWKYDEDDSLINYLVGSEWEKDYTRTKVEPEKAKIKVSKVFIAKDGKLVNTVTGEVVPGVTINDREPALVIKLEG